MDNLWGEVSVELHSFAQKLLQDGMDEAAVVERLTHDTGESRFAVQVAVKCAVGQMKSRESGRRDPIPEREPPPPDVPNPIDVDQPTKLRELERRAAQAIKTDDEVLLERHGIDGIDQLPGMILPADAAVTLMPLALNAMMHVMFQDRNSKAVDVLLALTNIWNLNECPTSHGRHLIVTNISEISRELGHKACSGTQSQYIRQAIRALQDYGVLAVVADLSANKKAFVLADKFSPSSRKQTKPVNLKAYRACRYPPCKYAFLQGSRQVASNGTGALKIATLTKRLGYRNRSKRRQESVGRLIERYCRDVKIDDDHVLHVTVAETKKKDGLKLQFRRTSIDPKKSRTRPRHDPKPQHRPKTNEGFSRVGNVAA